MVFSLILRGFCGKLTGKKQKFTSFSGEDHPGALRAGYRQIQFWLSKTRGWNARA
jgi:hypothetical protein